MRTQGAYQIAAVYAARGQIIETLTWLERANALHDAGLWILQVDPLLRGLREQPRFIALKRKPHMTTPGNLAQSRVSGTTPDRRYRL